MMTRPPSLELRHDGPRAEVLAHRAGGMLVTGPSGAGKTTLLRDRFAAMVEEGADPEAIALITLSRRAARDAREWVIRRLDRSLGDLPIFTAHGYAFRLVSVEGEHSTLHTFLHRHPQPIRKLQNDHGRKWLRVVRASECSRQGQSLFAQPVQPITELLEIPTQPRIQGGVPYVTVVSGAQASQRLLAA